MFFGKSYSDSAVDNASHWIRFLDNLEFLLTRVQEAEHQDVLVKFYGNTHLGVFDREKIDAAKRFSLFQDGIILGVLEHVFDGSPSDFKKFEKDAIIKALNYGFLMNEGKSFYKGYAKRKGQYSKYKKSGLDWAENFYVPTIIEQNLTLEDILEYIKNPPDEIIDLDESSTEYSEEIDNRSEIDEEFIEDEEFERESGHSLKIFQSANFNQDKRIQCYIDLWNIEKEKSKVLLNSDVFETLDNELHVFTNGIIEGPYEKTRHPQHWKVLGKVNEEIDKCFIFDIFSCVQEVFESQNLQVKVGFKIPNGNMLADLTPEYEEHKYFKIRDDIISKNSFSFSDIGRDFPKTGNLLHLGFGMDLNLIAFMKLIQTDGADYEVMSYERRLLFDHLSISTEFEKLPKEVWEIQMRTIELGLKSLGETYQNSWSRLLNEIKQWEDTFNRPISERVGLKIEDSMRKLGKKKKENFDDKAVSYKKQLRFDLTYMPISNPELLFENLIEDLPYLRRDYYEEHGKFFDSLEMKVLNLLADKNVPINPKRLNAGYGYLPLTVRFALQLERFFETISGEVKKYSGHELRLAESSILMQRRGGE